MPHIISLLYPEMPGLYDTESILADDKLVHVHFVLGDSHWYAVEFDGEDLFFGYVILNGDEQNAEWGYFSWQELHDLEIGPLCVEIDGEWVTKRFGERELVCVADRCEIGSA